MKEVTAIDILEMHSGLSPETIKKSYSWAISAMNEYASRKVLESEVEESVNFPEGESNLNEVSPLNTVHPSTSDSLNKEGAYILIAYRYGHKDGHSYLVDICDGIGTASERAEEEANERGGKYSVSVFAVRLRGEVEEIYVAKCPEHYTQGTTTPHQLIEKEKADGDYWKLETLKRVKEVCEIYSDSSARTLAYNWICQEISKLESEQLKSNPAQKETNSP